MLIITKLSDNDQKSIITSSILRSLPEWFGIEKAILEYTDRVQNSDFYAAYCENVPVGFVSIKPNNKYTSEIYVMGILKEHQNIGIGKKLLENVQEELTINGVKFLMVKTLGDSDPDINYKNTREFYIRAGFYPLEEIKEIWGEENPCLIMVKAI